MRTIRNTLWAMTLLLAVAPAAIAADDKAQAQVLFDEARQLMEQGKFHHACSRFESSAKLDPAMGTLLSLASCYELVGRTASAWAAYLEAAGAPNQPARAQFARQRADALAPTLSRLTVEAPNPPANLHVTRDGKVLPQAVFGVPIPVDPGRHVIEATAPGRALFHQEVTVAAAGGRSTVVVTLTTR